MISWATRGFLPARRVKGGTASLLGEPVLRRSEETHRCAVVISSLQYRPNEWEVATDGLGLCKAIERP